jgi:hypothetical protein
MLRDVRIADDREVFTILKCFANDTLVQTISVKAIGSGKLLYSIEKNIKDDGMYGGRLIENFNGTANWSGAYGVVVGEDMTMHLDQW